MRLAELGQPGRVGVLQGLRAPDLPKADLRNLPVEKSLVIKSHSPLKRRGQAGVPIMLCCFLLTLNLKDGRVLELLWPKLISYNSFEFNAFMAFAC